MLSTIFKTDRACYKRIFGLAIPIIFSNVGQMTVTIADNMMVGQLGKVPLGVASFSGMLIMSFMVVGIGYSIGLTPLVARNIVLGRKELCITLFKNSIVSNSIIGIMLSSLLLAIYPLLGMFGQPQEVVDQMGGYYVITALSIIPYMVFLSFKQFLEGLGNTSVAMVISVICNVLNIILNYLLIFGKCGFPEWGVFGAGFATFVSRLSMPLMFLLYQKFSIYKSYIPRITISGMSRRVQKSLFFNGYPISLQMAAEFFSLTFITIMMGWLGVIELAANQIAYSMMSIMYLIVCGISSAVTILTAFEYGKRSTKGIKSIVVSGVQISAVLMIVSAIMLINFGETIAKAFTTDVDVINLAAIYMTGIGAAQIFDGIQVTLLGALRGIGDVKAPMLFSFVLYGIVCICVAYTFGFIFEYRGIGVWLGFAVGLMLASLVYGIRLFTRLKKIF